MKKRTISVILTLALCFSLSTAVLATGSDQPSSWAVDQVNAAIAANLVPQSLQSRYTQAITRAEFCALAVTLYESIRGEITGRVIFTDTADRNVAKMAYLGVVSGVGNDLFAPHAYLTREEAAVILVRLADAIGDPLPMQTAEFADNVIISPWAIESAGQIQAAGVMGGIGNNLFAPRQPYTIEQSIITILRLHHILAPVVVNLFGQEITDRRLAEMVTSGEIPANVTNLRLTANSITDVTPLRTLTDLTVLDLWGNNITDLSPLSNLTNLTELVLWGNEFESIAPLGNLVNLTNLSIGSHRQFDGNLSILSNLVNLTQLGFGGSQINDFSPIGSLDNLTHLQMWGVTGFRDLSVLENLTNLTNLNIHAANIEDFTPLRNFTNLTRLDLQHNRIRDISVLALDSLPNLTELFLWSNQITDITPLSGLTSLSELALSSNQITDISPLSEMTSLEFLFLRDNQIEDVSPLSGLTALINLFLDENQIDDISPLRTLRSLQQLVLDDNPLTDEQINELQTALPNLSISAWGHRIVFPAEGGNVAIEISP